MDRDGLVNGSLQGLLENQWNKMGTMAPMKGRVFLKGKFIYLKTLIVLLWFPRQKTTHKKTDLWLQKTCILRNECKSLKGKHFPIVFDINNRKIFNKMRSNGWGFPWREPYYDKVVGSVTWVCPDYDIETSLCDSPWAHDPFSQWLSASGSRNVLFFSFLFIQSGPCACSPRRECCVLSVTTAIK